MDGIYGDIELGGGGFVLLRLQAYGIRRRVFSQVRRLGGAFMILISTIISLLNTSFFTIYYVLISKIEL
jgi:hypothetical protein